MKRGNIILIITFLILISSFLFYTYSFIDFKKSVDIGGRAVKENLGLSISIIPKETNLTVPNSGNMTFSSYDINRFVTMISGLNSGYRLNISMYTNIHPTDWNEPAPTQNEVGTKLKYFELNSDNTSSGSYKIYFNVSRADLGNINPNNIKLFVYENNWTGLPTYVVNANSDPLSFYAIATHFSKFLIGETPTISEQPQATSSTINRVTSSDSDLMMGTEQNESSDEILPETIHEKGALFDVTLSIPKKYTKLLIGEGLVAVIELTNIKGGDVVDVNLTYSVKDSNQSIIHEESETMAVENKISFFKRIVPPQEISPGDYMFLVDVKYNGDVASAGRSFKIIEDTEVKKSFERSYIIVFIIIITSLISIVFLYFEHRRLERIERSIKRK